MRPSSNAVRITFEQVKIRSVTRRPGDRCESLGGARLCARIPIADCATNSERVQRHPTIEPTRAG
jgi:hypothetical protein